MPEQSLERPADDYTPDWEELKDEEIDPGIRDDLLELTKIDEKKFWTDEELARKLEHDTTFAPSVWLGYQILLESQGFEKKGDILTRFEELTDSFTGGKQGATLKEQLKDIHELKKFLSSLGFSERELSAKETLKRAYFGYVDRKDEEALLMLQRAMREDSSLRKALEDFDKEARGREGRE
jgi:hypothetical protein